MVAEEEEEEEEEIERKGSCRDREKDPGRRAAAKGYRNCLQWRWPSGRPESGRGRRGEVHVYIYRERSEVKVEVEVVGSIYIEGFFGFCVEWPLCVENTTNSPARKSTEFESVSRSEFFAFFFIDSLQK